MLQSVTFTDAVYHFGSGLIPTVLVAYVQWRHSREEKVKEQSHKAIINSEIKEIMPSALATFREDLLDKMNGTYLRTAEAKVHFNNIEKSLERIEKKVDSWE